MCFLQHGGAPVRFSTDITKFSTEPHRKFDMRWSGGLAQLVTLVELNRFLLRGSGWKYIMVINQKQGVSY